MKRFVLLSALLAATLVVAAQTPTASELKFRETTWDFGEIREADGPVTHTFGFMNRSPKPVVITQVSVSCGCTTPKYSKEPVQPGRMGTLEVEYDPANRPGPFVKEIYVNTSGGAREVIRIRGTVVARPRTVEEDYGIVVAPGLRISAARAEFSYIGQGTAKSMTAGYANTGDKPVTLTAVAEPASPWFSVSSPGTVCAGCRGEITLTYNLSGTQEVWGVLGNRVLLSVDGRQSTTEIQATAYGVDDFSELSDGERSDAARARFDRQFHNFGDVGANEKPTQTFTVRNDGKKTLMIRAVQAGTGVESSLRPGIAIEPGGQLAFTLTVRPDPKKQGRFFENVTIVMNDPSRPVREIRLSGNVR